MCLSQMLYLSVFLPDEIATGIFPTSCRSYGSARFLGVGFF